MCVCVCLCVCVVCVCGVCARARARRVCVCACPSAVGYAEVTERVLRSELALAFARRVLSLSLALARSITGLSPPECAPAESP